MTTGERIKRQRKANGLTQENLGNAIGASIKTIQRWEWGQQSPRAEELAKLASVLNTTVGYLMGLEDAPAAPVEPAPQPAPAPPKAKVEDMGTLTYTFANGQKLEVPATPEFAREFWARVDKLMGIESKEE